MKVDLIYLAHTRPEFTRASLEALRVNTNWDLVKTLTLYCDQPYAEDVLQEMVRFTLRMPLAELPLHSVHLEAARTFGGPVAIMNHFLVQDRTAPVFAKIDNDVIVPSGWLDACVRVMETCPELDLLGIEPPASRTPAPWANGQRIPAPELSLTCRLPIGPAMRYAQCDAIGGIGLMRRSAFANRDAMKPHSIYGGFTDWQIAHPEVVKGWIVPPLNVFLLDRLPIEPWASLSREYIAKGWQRPWTNYPESASALWDWWQPSEVLERA